jgi:hypothetical protein
MLHERNQMAKKSNNRPSAVTEPLAITEIRVAGFKSLSEEQRIEIRPLTILAGANSSGKSSIMQPVLLLKQTLEASYDPGTLLLNGPNIKFTLAEQLLSRIGKGHALDTFQVGMRLNTGGDMQIRFRKEHTRGFRSEQMEISKKGRRFILWPKMTHAEIVKTGITQGRDYSAETPEGYGQGHWEIHPARCFLEPAWVAQGPDGNFTASGHEVGEWEALLPDIIHLSGLRGNPERTYPTTAVGGSYPGTFEKYTASVIYGWMAEDDEILDDLNAELKVLKLAGGITAVPVNDVQIGLEVGRLPDIPPTRPEDRVNIADVGVGVSQTLPVLVALHAAKPGQLVYIEQPETHLHPRAQFALAQVLASAAKRGIRVVVETHSSLLLLGVETLVAEGNLSPDLVKLHWFQREKDGHTVVRSGNLDEAGRTGDWPEDFDNVTLHAQKRYMDAAEKRLFAQ